MVTIKDIAEKAKVSTATVSHVLNKTRFVSKELIHRVYKAVEELDYYPNTMAGSLRSNKTMTIGLIVPDSSNSLFASLSTLIENEFSNLNYSLILCNSSYDSEKELDCIRVLRSKKVDGLIIIPIRTEPDQYNLLVDRGLPVILLHHIVKGYDAGTVSVNNFKGIYEATKYLIELGHKKIGYIDRPQSLTHSIERQNGYISALEENGLSFDDERMIKSLGFDFEGGYKAMKILLKGKNVTSVIAFNDISAVGAMKAIKEAGLKVPLDISVIGFDDIDLCSYVNPQLTTVHFPKRNMAASAVKILFEKINNPEKIRDSKSDVLPLRLIKRDSTSEVLTTK